MEECAPQGQRQEEQGGGQVHLPLVQASYGIVMHKLSECCLGKERKEEQQKTKPAYIANSATYATATVSMVDPALQALLATIGTALQAEDKDE
jgi:hypothetical protein